MRTHLLFYWYVPQDGWHEIYDLHLKSLRNFAWKFDHVTFVIASDGNCGDLYGKMVSDTIDRLTEIAPSSDFVMYGNDKVLRESYYFRNEVALKLGTFPDDEVVFFVHNKGVASDYVPKEELYNWVTAMYFSNLSDFEKVLGLFEKETVCCIGTRKIVHAKPWAFLKYRWHYSGTFFWMAPRRIHKLIVDRHEEIPRNDRYFTEGFLGSVIPDSEDYSVGLPDKPFYTDAEKKEYDKIYAC